MNERIKQLAEQAGSTHKQNLGVYQFYTDELEKFAELIVKECTDIANGTRYDGKVVANRIKFVFGVEE
jgi:phosphate-selective porin